MRITKDLLSGLLFIALGGGGALIALNYRFGSPSAMGPGFFPVVLGAAIALMGMFIAGRAVIRPDSSEPVARWDLRPLLFVCAGIALFGLLVRNAGLIAALVVLIAVARLAGREGGSVELLVMILVLTAVAAAIFVYGLNMPLNLMPR